MSALSAHALAQAASGTKLIVLVQPLGSSTAVVMTFSHVVPHSAAKARLRHLAELTGARVAAVDIKNTSLGAPAGASRRPERQTGLQAILTGMTYSTDRAFLLQPFVTALGDLRQFEVMFLTQRVSGFSGLRDWSGDGVTVRLLQQGAPYRYRFLVTADATPMATIPVYEPKVEQTSGAVLTRRDRLRPKPWLHGAAVLCGSAVFIVMLIRARMRAAGRSGQHSAGKGEVGDHA